MIHLALQTEFSFKKCYQHMKDIHLHVVDGCVGIADLSNTFGHILLQKQADEHGFKPIFGVRLHVVPDDSKFRTCNTSWIFIARNDRGLKEIYGLVDKAYKQFYYFPKIFYSQINGVSTDVVIIASDTTTLKHDYVAMGQGYRNLAGATSVMIDNNQYPAIEDKVIYQLLAGARKQGDGYVNSFSTEIHPQHILSERHWLAEYHNIEAIDNTRSIAKGCDATIPKAGMVKWDGKHDLIGTMNFDKVKDWTPEYDTRLAYELGLIKDKGYGDYFLIVADMIRHAKKTMLIGPSRGSSAGSLVCYLMDITEVDPIVHNLIFERFIDLNRFDLPDIDVDFPDVKREKIVDYLKRKYGKSKVMCLANVNRLKPKSAIGEFAKALHIPAYETTEVKDAIIERSSGDARAGMCILDTFETTDAGKAFIDKYPAMSLVEHIEGHASHAGKHAAGILVSTLPLVNYGSLDERNGIIQMDKKGAEYLGLLKIDCLGLRTLSILESVAEQLGKPYNWFYTLPLDDERTYKLFNDMRLNGIFQFEGLALQLIVRRMGVNNFDDISAITALARPGALNSGGTARYIKYSTGEEAPTYYSDVHRSITGDTYGIVVYQEQMMEIARKIGGLDWKQTSAVRKAASKSLGDEYFNQFKVHFVRGALKNGYSEEDTEQLWVDISASGSWSFNKSHAVSYGLVSYWTAYCKAHHPAEFAVACLNHAVDTNTSIKLLRDLVRNDGFTYVPVDPDTSSMGWSKQSDTHLVGGLCNLKGIGVAKARTILKARKGEARLTPSLMKKLMNPVTDFDVLFPANHYFGFLYNDPVSAGLDGRLCTIDTIDDIGEYIFIGKLVDRNIRDLNEHIFVQRRGGEIIEHDNLYLNMKLEDDNGIVTCRIKPHQYEAIGRAIAEKGILEKSWYLVRGKIVNEWRTIWISEIVNLNEYYPEIGKQLK